MQSLMTFTLKTEQELRKFGSKLARALPKKATIYLYGPLGTGKTTLVRGCMQGLGYDGKVKSPTYPLIQVYELDHTLVLHVDLYRIADPRELEELGLLDYFSRPSICFIEWPEKGMGGLPLPDIECYLEFLGNQRSVVIKALSNKGEAIIHQLNVT